MIDQLTRRITAVENELSGCRREKILFLQAQVAAVEALLPSQSGKAVPPSPVRRHRKVQAVIRGWAAELLSNAAAQSGGNRPAKVGRHPAQRVPDGHLLPAVMKLISASGKEGISARSVSGALGVFQPRIAKLLAAHFKKTGQRKGTRYHLK